MPKSITLPISLPNLLLSSYSVKYITQYNSTILGFPLQREKKVFENTANLISYKTIRQFKQ